MGGESGSDGVDSAEMTRSIFGARSLSPGPVAVAWLLTVSVDLFFNAGLLTSLFDQEREPSLLSDEVLFRRIPVAYVALAIGVTALAWVLDRLDRGGAFEGAIIGAVAGVVVASLGIVSLWTAIDMTLPFLIAGATVQLVELTVAGTYLGAVRTHPNPKSLRRLGILMALSGAVAAVILQNLIGG